MIDYGLGDIIREARSAFYEDTIVSDYSMLRSQLAYWR